MTIKPTKFDGPEICPDCGYRIQDPKKEVWGWGPAVANLPVEYVCYGDCKARKEKEKDASRKD